MSDKTLSRRNALKLSLAAGVAATACSQRARAIDYPEAVPEAKGLTAYLKDGQVQIRWNNMPLTVYRAQAALKYPYFYPVNSLGSGTSLTTESALPYPHHRGLWFSCDPLNGGNYWGDNGLDSGQVRSDRLELGEVTASSVEIQNDCTWVRKDGPSPCHDERVFTVRMLSDTVWTIDVAIRWIADQPIEIKRAKHSLFAIRAASDISCPYGGTLINSEGGEGADGTYGKEARWCGYFGKRAGRPDLVEGITVMTHPDNPWKPIWFTREYGHLSPSPFNFLDAPWKLPQGESVALKYRVALHVGNPKEADMDGVYHDWLKTVG
jgi:hypothetical protein